MKTQLMIMKGSFDKSLFVIPDKNRGDNKPISGGIWTSTLIGKDSSDWDKFTSSEEFYEEPIMKYIVEPKAGVRVLTINSLEDYQNALEIYGMNVDINEYPMAFSSNRVLDYSKIIADFDCLRLTEDGLYANRMSFYTWDCESTIWFNTDGFDISSVL